MPITKPAKANGANTCVNIRKSADSHSEIPKLLKIAEPEQMALFAIMCNKNYNKNVFDAVENVLRSTSGCDISELTAKEWFVIKEVINRVNQKEHSVLPGDTQKSLKKILMKRYDIVKFMEGICDYCTSELERQVEHKMDFYLDKAESVFYSFNL